MICVFFSLHLCCEESEEGVGGWEFIHKVQHISERHGCVDMNFPLELIHNSRRATVLGERQNLMVHT